VSAITGGVGGLLSAGAETFSRLTTPELQTAAGLGGMSRLSISCLFWNNLLARQTAEVFIEGSKNVLSDTVKYETRAALGAEKVLSLLKFIVLRLICRKIDMKTWYLVLSRTKSPN
jgi:hypothetical protein